MAKAVYEIDGKNFDTIDGFFDEISRVLIPGAAWGRNLNAFNDILRGGFGTPEGGFVLRWVNSAHSRTRLGYPETVRVLERVARAYPAELALAKQGIGPTVFDWLIEIIEVHGDGGEESEDGVELVLD